MIFSLVEALIWMLMVNGYVFSSITSQIRLPTVYNEWMSKLESNQNRWDVYIGIMFQPRCDDEGKPTRNNSYTHNFRTKRFNFRMLALVSSYLYNKTLIDIEAKKNSKFFAILFFSNVVKSLKSVIWSNEFFHEMLKILTLLANLQWIYFSAHTLLWMGKLLCVSCPSRMKQLHFHIFVK